MHDSDIMMNLHTINLNLGTLLMKWTVWQEVIEAAADDYIACVCVCERMLIIMIF